ncbi:MAG: rubredoxin [Eubacteriales bacterium]|nr:rubredoxin [Eubacteriales bacterium]
MKRFVCSVCGYVYDEVTGIPASGIAPGTPWERLPGGWACPRCHTEMAKFQPTGNLTAMEKSALCSNLARGCEKQYMPTESTLFTTLSAFFAASAPKAENASLNGLQSSVQADLEDGLPTAKTQAEAYGDRGAQRALVWADKVTRIQKSLLSRYEKQGEAMLEGQNVYLCTICGFIAVGDAPPPLCPVCKAPDWKFEIVQGR